MSICNRRLETLRQQMAEAGAAAMLIQSPANVYYLTGFAGEGQLVVSATEAVLASDTRYKMEAEGLSAAVTSCFHPRGHLAGSIEALQAAEAGVVAFESSYLVHAALVEIQNQLPDVTLLPVKEWVEEQRLVKDDGEIAAIREAARRVDQALAAFIARLQPGRSERELALELEMELVRAGTEKSFAIIMASGPSAAAPHAVPGERLLQPGDLLKIDVGGKWEQYCSDITRTYCLGEADERFREIYGVVLEAQSAALARVGPGMKGAELDQAARKVISAAGYGEYFTHSLGHGVGLEVHEGPRVSARSTDTLAPGMVVTIEPGIYLPGWGGVRIEDMVLVTEQGSEVLTGAPKEPEAG
jgi:Xaa-Pro aminopeptidase